MFGNSRSPDQTADLTADLGMCSSANFRLMWLVFRFPYLLSYMTTTITHDDEPKTHHENMPI